MPRKVRVDLERVAKLRDDEGLTAKAIAREMGLPYFVARRALRELGPPQVDAKAPAACFVCAHPKNEEITRSIIEHGVTPTSKSFGVSCAHLWKHRRHLRKFVALAADMIIQTDRSDVPDLVAIRQLLRLMKRVAVAAHNQQDFKASAVAGKVALQAVELLISGGVREAKNGGAAQDDAMKRAAERPTTGAEREAQAARHVREITNNFDPAEIARLKLLATPEVTTDEVENSDDEPNPDEKKPN